MHYRAPRRRICCLCGEEKAEINDDIENGKPHGFPFLVFMVDFIVLFNDEKYQKSARRALAVLLANLLRRARVSRANHAWQVRAAQVNGASQ